MIDNAEEGEVAVAPHSRCKATWSDFVQVFKKAGCDVKTFWGPRPSTGLALGINYQIYCVNHGITGEMIIAEIRQNGEKQTGQFTFSSKINQLNARLLAGLSPGDSFAIEVAPTWYPDDGSTIGGYVIKLANQKLKFR